MKTQSAHAHEDRLLDFAYEELPPSEARLMEQHLQGCSRCTEALASIRGVRTSMARLAPEPAPEAGLDSLLAYAQQSARRSAAGPEPKASGWRRLLAPALSLAAVSVLGVVVLQVNRQVDLSPALHKGTVQQPAHDYKAESVSAPTPPNAVARLPPPPPPTAAAPPAETTATPPAEPESLSQPVQVARESKQAVGASAHSASRSSLRDEARADWSNVGATGSGGGFPTKKYSQDLHESLGDDAYAVSKPAPKMAKSKGAMAPAKSAMAGVSSFDERQQAAPSEAALDDEKAAPGGPAQDGLGAVASASGGASKDKAEAPRAAAAEEAPANPPMASAAPAPMPASRASSLYREEKKADSAQASGSMSARRSPSVGELLQQADIAHREGDSEQEVAFLRAALTAGIQGTQRVDVFSRLCEAESVLGHRSNAVVFCKQVVTLAPGSQQARGAQRLLEGELQAPADADTKAASPAAH